MSTVWFAERRNQKYSRRGQVWEELPGQQTCLLKSKNYPSLACFWILIEFNSKLRGGKGYDKKKKTKSKKIIKADKKDRKWFIVLLITFILMSCPIIQLYGTLTDALYTAMNIWCTAILLSFHSQIFQWVIHKCFRETHFSMIVGTDNIIFHTRLND